MATFELINNTGKGQRKYEKVNKGWRIKVRKWALLKVKTHFGAEKRTKTQVILLSQNTDAATQQRSESFNLFF